MEQLFCVNSVMTFYLIAAVGEMPTAEAGWNEIVDNVRQRRIGGSSLDDFDRTASRVRRELQLDAENSIYIVSVTLGKSPNNIQVREY